MSTTQILVLIAIGYILLQNGALSGLLGGTTGTAGTGTETPTPTGPTAPLPPTSTELAACAAAGGMWDAATGTCVPSNVVTPGSDPVALAQKLIVAAQASQGISTTNPVFSYDQWNWIAVNAMHPPLSPPDFTTVAPRDANGNTPSVTALQYADNFVKLSANPAAGLSGLYGLNALAGTAPVIQLRPAGGNKWRM
jgi:hypothetical protein